MAQIDSDKGVSQVDDFVLDISDTLAFQTTTEDNKPKRTLFLHGHAVEFLCDTGADKTVVRKPLPGIPHSSEMIYVKSANGIISSCPVTGPITVVDPHSGLKHTQSVILCPSCPVNLLGRDLMLKLHISVVSTDSGMMAIGQGEEVPTYISSGQEPHYYWTLDFPQPDPTNTMTRLLQLADESLRHMADADTPKLLHITLRHNNRPGPDEEYQHKINRLGPQNVVLTYFYSDLQYLSACAVALTPQTLKLHQDTSISPHVSLTRPSTTSWQAVGCWMTAMQNDRTWTPAPDGWERTIRGDCMRKALNWVVTTTPQTHLDNPHELE